MTDSNFGGAPERPTQTAAQEELSGKVVEYLYDVIDPELGINVVDLGLVYDTWIEQPQGATKAVINMTLTSPACPLTDVLEEQIEQAVTSNTEVDEVELNWVWMPPWGPHMITEEGREQLRALGFSV
ncbi:metal-sulfur cluster assembly factor [Corynebacterium mayonis]|uniref:metal-sulfur cluster assembly factor n=1 Tax=Corynebacterium mayonis TaxID=3062461 RepID=UPI00314096CF